MIDFDLGVSLRTLEICQTRAREWRNDPNVWRWTRQNDLITKESHENWLECLNTDKSVRMYAVHKKDRGAVGVCGFTSVDLLNRHAEFSLYIAPDSRNQGYSVPALLTLFFHGFQNMGLNQVWGETFENNHAQGIFRKIGMLEDGRRRKFYWKDGQFWDAILFSVMRDEFLAKHGERSCFS